MGGKLKMKNRKRVFLLSLIFLILFSVISFAALYPNAVLVFSGIKMVNNGGTTQGFVDITLKNIEATGVSFCLKYDKDKIELSNAQTNVRVDNPASGNITTHEYFEQNTKDFPTMGPINCFLDFGTKISEADADSGYLMMNFLPITETKNSETQVPTIKKDNKDDTLHIMANSAGGLRLGRLSFRIKNPAEFARLSRAEINNLIQVVSFAESGMPQPESSEDDTGIHISYIGEDEKVWWHSRKEYNIDYKINIKAEIKDVKPQVSRMEVNSYEIYKTGSKEDLLDFLNRKMSLLTIFCTDNSELPAVMNWTEEDIKDINWNPAQGEYTITGLYNDSSADKQYPIEVALKVNPVKLVGYIADNQNITYFSDADDFPTDVAGLTLPDRATPILEPYIKNCGISDLFIQEYFPEGGTTALGTNLPPGFKDGGTFVFTGRIGNILQIQTDNPWLTVDINATLKVTRTVVTDESNMPNTLNVDSAVVDDNGILKLIVSNLNSDPIPDGTEFIITLPGGEELQTEDLETDGYTVTITDGKAYIDIKGNINDINSYPEYVAKILNLGGRAGEFTISSKEPGKPMGDRTPFTPETRTNKYIEADYTFDYSDSLAGIMPVKAGENLSTVITLPRVSDYISTTYDGIDGSEQGHLRTFEVISWTISGDINQAGSVVTATGTLKECEYTNYGMVKNPDDVDVVIKYRVAENVGKDSIAAIDDFVFDRRQVGYGYGDLQTKTFTVSNTGSNDIYGLTATIMLNAETQTALDNPEPFIISRFPVQILPSGKSQTFDIRPVTELPVGKYVANVTLSSNNGNLQTFKITFEVTEEAMYKLKLTSNDSTYGTVKTQTETYSFAENEEVTIIAIPADSEDYEFVEWSIKTIGSGVTLDNASNATTKFEMPAMDIEIEAKFQETIYAKLRLDELIVKDAEDKVQDLYNDEWSKIEFDPITREYYVAIPSFKDDEKNKAKIWFTLRDTQEARENEITSSATLTYSDDITNPNSVIVNNPSGDKYFKTDLFSTKISPTENTVVIKLSYIDDDNNVYIKEYTIHIFRKLNKSELSLFKYGNSPYGLIMNDISIDESDKETIKTAFINNNYAFVGSAPAGGTLNVNYDPRAWNETGSDTNVNYDLDDYALFVINDETFADTGYEELRNSIGQPVTTDVTVQITVNLLAEPITDKKDGSPGDFVNIEAKTITIPDTTEITQLKDQRIRPDVYQLTYTFTDFDGSSMSVQKPLIILSAIGDYNIDKVANDMDVKRNLNRFSKEIASYTNVINYETGGRLYRYRICDVSKDGNVNAIDANCIRANSLVEFYNNT